MSIEDRHDHDWHDGKKHGHKDGDHDWHDGKKHGHKDGDHDWNDGKKHARHDDDDDGCDVVSHGDNNDFVWNNNGDHADVGDLHAALVSLSDAISVVETAIEHLDQTPVDLANFDTPDAMQHDSFVT